MFCAGLARTTLLEMTETAGAAGPTCLPSLAQLLQTTMIAPSISTLLGEARRGEPQTSQAAFMMVRAFSVALKTSLALDVLQLSLERGGLGEDGCGRSLSARTARRSLRNGVSGVGRLVPPRGAHHTKRPSEIGGGQVGQGVGDPHSDKHLRLDLDSRCLRRLRLRDSSGRVALLGVGHDGPGDWVQIMGGGDP